LFFVGLCRHKTFFLAHPMHLCHNQCIKTKIKSMHYLPFIIFDILALALFSAFIFFILGLINPDWVPQFTKKQKTRKRSCLIYGLVFVFSLSALFLLATDQKKKQDKNDNLAKTETVDTSLPKCFDSIAGPEKRSTKDLPDDSKGKQFHILYVVPKDGEDKQLDTDGRLAGSVSAFQNWLCNQTKGKYFRLDTYQGKLDITFVRLPQTAKEISAAADLQFMKKYFSDSSLFDQPQFAEIAVHLYLLGFKNPNKTYATFYEGSGPKGACGQSGLQSKFSVVYLDANTEEGASCGFEKLTADYLKPAFGDFIIGHELIHSQGNVPTCSPHQAGKHVVDDPADIMFSPNDDPQSRPRIWHPYPVLDANHDDYYGANIPKCPDLKNSPFLTGGENKLPKNNN